MKSQIYVFFFSLCIIMFGCDSTKFDRDRFDLAIAEAENYYQQSDTLKDLKPLNDAINYYRLKEDLPLRGRAYYLRGYQHYLRGNYTDAIVDYIQTERTALLSKDSTALGLAYRAMADAYHELWDNAMALEYYKNSLDIFLTTNNITYLPFARIDYAKALLLNNAHKLSDSIANICLVEGYTHNDTVLLLEALRLKGRISLDQSCFSESKTFFEQMFKLAGNSLPEQDIEWLGVAYSHSNEVNSARKLKVHLDTIGFPTEWLAYNISVAENDTINQLRNLKKMFCDNESLLGNISRRNLQAISNAKSEQLSNELAAEKNLKSLYIITFTLTIIIVLIAAYSFYQRKKYHFQTEIRQNTQAINSAGNLLSELNSTINVLQAEKQQDKETAKKLTQNLLHNQIKLLDDILSKISLTQFTKKGNHKIYSDIQIQILSLTKNRVFLHVLIDIINFQHNNLFSRLREQICTLTDDDLYLYLLISSGFSTTTLCIIFNLETGQFHSRKSYLKKKIKASGAPDIHEFLSIL